VRWALAAPLLVLALLSSPAFAQPQSAAAAPSLRFDVERYQIEGNTLLEPRVIERTVAPYTGKGKDFSDIQRALAALEVAYRDRGYGTVQVILPEQNIGTGVVLFKIVEPQLARVTIEGAERSDAANIRRSIPALREGYTPNSTQIARNLMLANENPARSATVLLRADEQAEDKVEATIKVVEDKPWKASFTLDNTGNGCDRRLPHERRVSTRQHVQPRPCIDHAIHHVARSHGRRQGLRPGLSHSVLQPWRLARSGSWVIRVRTTA
jgi:hemolysin activation/secretion protein